MTFKNLLTISAGAASVVAIAMPAQANGLTGFLFDAHTTYANNPTEDIFLQSVTHNDITITDFSLVTGAELITNGSHLGPSSTDLGDDATSPNGAGATEMPNGQQVVDFLGNLNLNNIVDTEDTGVSVFELAFDGPVNTFYLFERGINSAFTVEALDDAGAVIDNFRIDQNLWSNAGYSIDTTEIGGAQKVGSYGLSLDQSISKVRIISNGVADNGPDYKIVAANIAQVPEPGSMAALALLGGAAAIAKRRKSSAQTAA